MSRISIKDIIDEEIWTFIDFDECIKNKVTLQDFLKYPHPKKYGCKLDYHGLFIYFGLPFILSTIIISTKLMLFDWSIILTSMSIFIGLLLNMLLLLYDITRKYQNTSQSSEIENDPMKNLLLRQTYINISFDIVIGVLSIILILLSPKHMDHTNSFIIHLSHYYLNINILCIIHTIFQFVVYGLIILFILHLLVIIRRIYQLVKEEFES